MPAANVLGEAGRGFKVAMEVLNSGRMGLAAGCLGGCKRMLQLAVERANERKAFGRPIGEFGMIKEKIARMMCETYALESMTYLTTGLIDAGVHDYSLESAICKVFGSETYWMVANEYAADRGGHRVHEGVPLRADAARRAHQPDLRGHQRDPPRLHRAGRHSEPGQAARGGRARPCASRSRASACSHDFAVKQARAAFGRERFDARPSGAPRRGGALRGERGRARTRGGAGPAQARQGHRREAVRSEARIAEVAIDLYALSAVLARTTRTIEQKGEEGAQREIELAHGFRISPSRGSRTASRRWSAKRTSSSRTSPAGRMTTGATSSTSSSTIVPDVPTSFPLLGPGLGCRLRR